jgi:uncharacterized membrane protein YagU involved in acid resistance
MTKLNNSNSKSPGVPFFTIIKAGLLAGTLDICFAFLYSYIKRGSDPATVLQYISKAALGKTAFTDPVVLTISGLLIHFTIAMAWTILFFILYRWLNLVKLNKIVTGVIYGLFVWAMMSIVILPLWNNEPFVFNAESASINAMILIAAIGLPLSFIAHHYYSKKNN